MKAYALAQAECANHVCGECIMREKPCRLAAKKIQPCDYFETAVLPLVDIIPYPYKGDELRAAKEDYRERCGVLTRDRAARHCPECGDPLPKRKRFCEACSIRRRRATYRENKKKGMAIPQLSLVSSS